MHRSTKSSFINIQDEQFTYKRNIKARSGNPCYRGTAVSITFEKYSDIKFRENPSNGTRVVPCGPTDGRTDRHDIANRSFRSFANAPKNELADFRNRDGVFTARYELTL